MYRSVEVKVRTPPIDNSVLKSLTMWPFFLTRFLVYLFSPGSKIRQSAKCHYLYVLFY